MVTSSHPRTFKVLKRLVQNHNTNITELIADDSLSTLSLIVKLFILESGSREFEISIPKELNDKCKNLKRISNCLSFWIPYLLEISYEMNKSFQLSLNVSDSGNKNFVSMVGSNYEKIVPDEYCMFEALSISNQKIWSNYQEFKQSWMSRKNIMFWRGSTTGEEFDSLKQFQDLKRIRVCSSFNVKSKFDMKITNIIQNKIPKQIIRKWLSSQNLLSNRVRESRFSKYKYYPDLPGNNDNCGSWGTIKKHLRGNLVFQPNHSSKLFYYQYMEPWVHFIPIALDFSDLEIKLDWAELNYEQACNISWNGYNVANNYLRNLKTPFIKIAKNNLEIIDH